MLQIGGDVRSALAKNDGAITKNASLRPVGWIGAAQGDDMDTSTAILNGTVWDLFRFGEMALMNEPMRHLDENYT